MTFTASDASKTCQQWIQAKGKQGEFWSLVGAPTEQQSVACVFRYTTGALAVIKDGGDQILGQGVCAGFAGATGWIEDTGEEQRLNKQAQQAQQQQEVKQQARQRVADDAGALASGLQSVKASTATVAEEGLSGELTTLRSDLDTVHRGLQLVQRDPTDVVCSDAGVVSSDEGAMESDIGAMESSIAAFASDVQGLQSALTDLRRAQRAYENDSASNGYTASVPSVKQINAAVSKAHAAVAAEGVRVTDARSQAAQLLAEAKGYVTQANAACQRAGG